ncbi:MAG TPA: VOC family protein [Chloroflexota bacterium]|jgi:catechol 2,3-dioxygenase-like lactoylglutathione lyase family enzyme
MVKLTHACLITEDVGRLSAFYREVLRTEPQDAGPQPGEYFEFALGGAVLSLWTVQGAARQFSAGVAAAAANRSAMLEFAVDDVDAEYARLQRTDLGIAWVKSPTTQPWGNRAMYFRDPDGNLLNLYSLVRPA